MILYRIIDVLM